jgi:hypothetical protein
MGLSDRDKTHEPLGRWWSLAKGNLWLLWNSPDDHVWNGGTALQGIRCFLWFLQGESGHQRLSDWVREGSAFASVVYMCLQVEGTWQSHQNISHLMSVFLGDLKSLAQYVLNMWSKTLFVIYFFAVLEFELRAQHLLGRHSTTWSTPPALFAPFMSEIGSHFMPGLAWTTVLLFMLPGLLGWQAWPATPSFYLLRWGLVNFSPGLIVNYDPLDCHLSGSEDCTLEPQCLAIEGTPQISRMRGKYGVLMKWRFISKNSKRPFKAKWGCNVQANECCESLKERGRLACGWGFSDTWRDWEVTNREKKWN